MYSASALSREVQKVVGGEGGEKGPRTLHWPPTPSSSQLASSATSDTKCRGARGARYGESGVLHVGQGQLADGKGAVQRVDVLFPALRHQLMYDRYRKIAASFASQLVPESHMFSACHMTDMNACCPLPLDRYAGAGTRLPPAGGPIEVPEMHVKRRQAMFNPSGGAWWWTRYGCQYCTYATSRQIDTVACCPSRTDESSETAADLPSTRACTSRAWRAPVPHDGKVEQSLLHGAINPWLHGWPSYFVRLLSTRPAEGLLGRRAGVA